MGVKFLMEALLNAGFSARRCLVIFTQSKQMSDVQSHASAPLMAVAFCPEQATADESLQEAFRSGCLHVSICFQGEKMLDGLWEYKKDSG